MSFPNFCRFKKEGVNVKDEATSDYNKMRPLFPEIQSANGFPWEEVNGCGFGAISSKWSVSIYL
jgi:hypothetical protein